MAFITISEKLRWEKCRKCFISEIQGVENLFLKQNSILFLGNETLSDFSPHEFFSQLDACNHICKQIIFTKILQFFITYHFFTGAEPLVEYFVPRSMSEFDLSITSGDTPVASTFLPLTVRIPRKALSRPKEKVVTFEDEMASRIAKSPELQDIFMWHKG